MDRRVSWTNVRKILIVTTSVQYKFLSITNGHVTKLDMAARDELEPYLEHVRELPFIRQARVLDLGHERRGEDAHVVLDTPDEKVIITVEHKRSHLTNELAERLVHLRSTTPGLMVFAPAIGRDIAQRFSRAKLNFVDLAGNCHVEIGERYYVHIEGRRQEQAPVATRALRAPTYQVLFALLAKPALLTASARALAVAAGDVSPQTAADARRRLLDSEMLLLSLRRPRWAPGGWKRALDLFVAGFATTLAPSLTLGRYRARERGIGELDDAFSTKLGAPTTWRWGGGAACKRLTGFYRGDVTVIYVTGNAPNPSQLRIHPDLQGPIRIAARPCPVAFESPQPDTVHPLLAYADLLAENNDRATEAAAEVYDRYLASMSA